MWPLSVAVNDSGRCFCTAAAVSPGHVANVLFSVAFTNVLFVELNRQWWRYLIRSP